MNQGVGKPLSYGLPMVIYGVLFNRGHYLEDHPRTCKWLITMVIVSPRTGVVPLPNGFMAYKPGLLTTY